jgi:hypothetical protein
MQLIKKAINMAGIKYWFGFKQISPKPPGKAIASGPYSTFQEAKNEREKAKAWDCELSAPYSAVNNEEAEEKAKQYLS